MLPGATLAIASNDNYIEPKYVKHRLKRHDPIGNVVKQDNSENSLTSV